MIVDASVWASYFLPRDRFHSATLVWLAAQLSEGVPLVSPTLVLAEVAGAVARQSGDPRPGLAAAEEIRTLLSLTLLPVDDALARAAMQIAAGLQVKGADAVYLAAAQELAMPLITWDNEQLARGSRVVPTARPGDEP